VPAVAADDDLLFLREMADVVRVGSSRKRKAPVRETGPAQKPPPVEEEESRLFLEAVARLKVEPRFADVFTDTPASAPLAGGRLRHLRRGTIRIDLELDLHGLSREEALESLAAFVTGACRRGQKAVLVITGKGKNSPGKPVLQGAVAGWLRERGREMVAEFAPAPRDLGGEGAFVVFLRAAREGASPPGKR
jgi:DNA-nicking Smr family endonuclease